MNHVKVAEKSGMFYPITSVLGATGALELLLARQYGLGNIHKDGGEMSSG